jgi:hypothetical protein
MGDREDREAAVQGADIGADLRFGPGIEGTGDLVQDQ